MKTSDRLVRYRPAERINHWIVALCFVLASLSGLGFFFPSFNWLMLIFGTPQLARILHPFVGVVMFAAFMLMFCATGGIIWSIATISTGPEIFTVLP